LGYSRAAKLIDCLERAGVIGPKDGSKQREILADGEASSQGSSVPSSVEPDAHAVETNRQTPPMESPERDDKWQV
jgi:hypothetical protein